MLEKLIKKLIDDYKKPSPIRESEVHKHPFFWDHCQVWIDWTEKKVCFVDRRKGKYKIYKSTGKQSNMDGFDLAGVENIDYMID
jgi:hypothetical protein